MTTLTKREHGAGVVVRFAPSPTGRLHLGNIRPAVLNWLMARRSGGTFILRLDDTDRARSTEAFAAAIREDLAWLGLAWDRELRQSDRTDRYEAAAERLRRAGLLYPCFETADELDRRRKRQLARGAPPVYDRAALRLTAEERSRLGTEKQPHWRFRLANTRDGESLAPVPTPVTWNDAIRGQQTVDVGSLSDPVVIREDGTFLYTFTSVVDDVELAVTHVIRGEDHVTNTAPQIQVFEALGAAPPVFAHHSLLVAADGQALSKRLGSLAIADFRADGLEPLAIVAQVAQVGSATAAEAVGSLGDLAARFELVALGRSPVRFDPQELAALNARVLAALPFEAVAARLASLGIGGGTAFWEAIRTNIARLADAASWWTVVAGDITPLAEQHELLEVALRALPAEPWDHSTWPAWTTAVRNATGAKGRALFHPLRLALTGRETGPELKQLLPLMGRDRVVRRLTMAIALAAGSPGISDGRT